MGCGVARSRSKRSARTPRRPCRPVPCPADRGRSSSIASLPDQERWQTTEAWTGVLPVTASSSQANADAPPPLDRGTHPGAAIDRDGRTEWRTARNTLPDAQWWQVDLVRPTPIATMTVTAGQNSAAVPRMRIITDQTRSEPSTHPEPGRRVPIGRRVATDRECRVAGGGARATRPARGHCRGEDRRRRRAAVAATCRSPGQLRGRAGRSAPRFRTVRLPPDRQHDGVQSVPAGPGDDGDQLARRFAVSSGGDYRSTTRRRSVEVLGWPAARRQPRRPGAGHHVAGIDAAARPPAMTDGDLGTTWVSPTDSPAGSTSPGQSRSGSRAWTCRSGVRRGRSAPDRVPVRAGDREVTRLVDRDGHVALPGWRVRA